MPKHPLITQLQTQLKESQNHLRQAFYDGKPAAELIKQRTQLIDQTLASIWQHEIGTMNNLCLIAVGGYGRSELFPFSDIDILILSRSNVEPITEEKISRFFTTLWDIGLEVGHSYRTTDECLQQAKDDISIYSNLLDARLIIGDKPLFQQLITQLAPEKIWNHADFYAAKLQEQQLRHQKFNNTAYHLEPDIKNYPGNLRDIHMIYWLMRQVFGSSDFSDLVQQKMLTENECLSLREAEQLLWEIRFALHLQANRKEDRLLFDHQISLAKHFGYFQLSKKQAVEDFMKQYFRKVKIIVELNEILLQLFAELIAKNKVEDIQVIDEKYFLSDQYIGIKDEDTLENNPDILIEIFLKMLQFSAKGIQTQTLKLLRKHRDRINNDFRNDLLHKKLFLELLRCGHDITPVLRIMNRYGILGRYIPEFDYIVGQMQYDLFHIYTVDQHTIFLIQNIFNFSKVTSQAKFPLCHELMAKIPEREILYLAALFHDIGKGRGGDHSKLGANFAKGFCQNHQMTDEATALVAWLAQNHLLMSETAQRKDIHDPEIIKAFARQVKSQHYLNHLYLLTVVDICATNDKLWNSWKDSLLRQLYYVTHTRLEKRDKKFNKKIISDSKKQTALSLLEAQGYKKIEVLPLWDLAGEEYFLRENELSIAWHTEAILKHNKKNEPLVLARTTQDQGATEIFVYLPDQDNLFATTTAILDRCHLNVVEARIMTSRDGYSLDSYLVLNEFNQPITDEKRLERIQNLLQHYHSGAALTPGFSQRRIPLQMRHFSQKTRVHFKTLKKKGITELSVFTPDRPGLLARIGRAFMDCEVRLQNARIITLGDQVEDVFSITDRNNQPVLDKKKQHQLRERICYYLEQNNC